MNSPAFLWGSLTLAAAFIGNFVFFSVAAGLIVCVSQICQENPVTITDGLTRAWNYKRPIASWTLIGALLWISVGVYAYGFYLVTVFALPAIVLDNKDLVAAIRESVFIFRRLWAETYTAFGIILLLTVGCVLVALYSLGQAVFVYGLISSGIPDGMISLAVSVLMAIGLPVTGIATYILYTYEKTGVVLDR